MFICYRLLIEYYRETGPKLFQMIEITLRLIAFISRASDDMVCKVNTWLYEPSQIRTEAIGVDFSVVIHSQFTSHCFYNIFVSDLY